ncbi:VOC family protein [Rhodovarius crocodyli]|uniref:VOC family protein n=1 Tax=Rhodovarius crocodyli TaxID=1979269 RepID=A0A437MGB9_9PROT|nr:VOC family protein [Rhodovarius crocodyli]RVT96694.1 VOC family protein [Rhodovarius crocodyli]
MRFAVDRLDHLVINVLDVEVSASWYQRVLGMEREVFGKDNRTALRFGGQKVNLRPHDASPEAWHSSTNTQPGTQDLCFIVTVQSADVVEHLKECGIAIVEGPVVKFGALGPMNSVYCRDPDGNLIEISTYGD